MGDAGRLRIDSQRSGEAQNGHAEVMDALRIAAANLGLPVAGAMLGAWACTRGGLLGLVVAFTLVQIRWRHGVLWGEPAVRGAALRKSEGGAGSDPRMTPGSDLTVSQAEFERQMAYLAGQRLTWNRQQRLPRGRGDGRGRSQPGHAPPSSRRLR